jgi:uncharacterized membrane protein
MKHEYKTFYKTEILKTLSSSFCPEFAKPFERRMSQIGWITVKVTLRAVLLIFHNNYEYIIRSLCLNKMLNLSNTLDCVSHTSRMYFYSQEALS